MSKWDNLVDEMLIDKTKKALKKNGFGVSIVENGMDAKKMVLELIPEGSEVMNMTSVTLDSIGVSKEINELGRYNSVRNKLNSLDKNTHTLERQRLGAAPEYCVGSVHAITEDGHVLIASNTGSQLPAYVYGSLHVIWLVSSKKIVKSVDDGIKRIYEYILPKESERVKIAYGMERSAVNKLLIINKEIQKNRVHIIIIKEDLGF